MDIGPLKLRNPIILAAGILGDSPDMLQRAYLSGAGAVVTKTITSEPRSGNPEPNMMKCGEWNMNWVGLQNPGAKKFSKILGRPKYPCIVSLAADTPTEFADLTSMFDGILGFELNLSCPNVDGMCNNMENNPDLMKSIIRNIKGVTELPIFVKVGFQMYNTADSAIRAGASGITAINTIPGMCIDSNNNIYSGGLSGTPLKSMGLKMVYDLAKKYENPIIGCGGISSWKDAAEYFAVGASAIQVGTAAMSDLSILGKIADGLGFDCDGGE